MRQLRFPAAFIRGGTSNAIVFRDDALPADPDERDRLFLAAMGSPDPNGRQLNGMGGGISSLSKVCIVGRSNHPDADVDYTFAQISVGDTRVDYSANCGNMSSAIGPFAVDEALVSVRGQEAVVHIHNTNTGKIIRARFGVDDGEALIEGDTIIPGVAGAGAAVALEFLDPGGAATGRLLPTGRVSETIHVPGVGDIPVSIVDAANAFVFVNAATLGLVGNEMPSDLDANETLMIRLETIRAEAGVRMGLADTPEAITANVPSSPKVGLVSGPQDATTLAGDRLTATEGDFTARMVSMGNIHRALPLTGVLGLAVAAGIDGTVVNDVAGDRRGEYRIMQPSGVVQAATEVRASDTGWTAAFASVVRTQRRLFDGYVYVPASTLREAGPSAAADSP
ncbi:MAG: PrpF domain-containing protein [Pseudomonadota bacterium]